MGRKIKALAFGRQTAAAASSSGNATARAQSSDSRPATPPGAGEAGPCIRSRSPLYRHPAGTGHTKQVKTVTARARSRSPVTRPWNGRAEVCRERKQPKQPQERTQKQWIKEACKAYTAKHQELDGEKGWGFEFWGQAYKACVDYSLDNFHYGDDLALTFLVCKSCDQKISTSNSSDPCADRYGDPQFALYQHVTTAAKQRGHHSAELCNIWDARWTKAERKELHGHWDRARGIA